MTLILEGLDCPSCGAKIEQAAADLPQVNRARLNLIKQSLDIEANLADETQIEKQIRQIVERIEPGIMVYRKDTTQKTIPPLGLVDTRMLLRLGAGGALLGAALLVPLPGWASILMYVFAYLIVGIDVLWTALRNISRGQFLDENFLMSLATLVALATQQYPEAVAVMLFYQTGEFFQQYAVSRSRKNIADLMDIRPDYANRKTEEGWVKVHPEKVRIGEVILVKPGEKVPLDGVIEEGSSLLDTSALTGESMPRDVKKGDTVLSGSINHSGILKVIVSKSFGESTASKILELVESAASSQAKTEDFITRFAKYYTPAVVASAAVLAILPPLIIGGGWMTWLNRALVFLVVSCPCALVLSIPLSFFGGLGAASKHGILVKGSNYLEALNRVDTAVFDKTGTLTRGVFVVSELHPQDGVSDLLEMAAYAEHYSTHPIANSIRKAYGMAINENRLSDYHELAGEGTSVLIDRKKLLAGNRELMRQNQIQIDETQEPGTVVHIALEGNYLGWLLINDEIKQDSNKAITELKQLGVRRTVMLTGDRLTVAEKVNSVLGLDEVRAGLLPKDKVDAFVKLKQEKRKGSILFVGDGLNDAPVLAMADVGVAMGGLGTDAAIEAADLVLMADEPFKLVQAVKIARYTHRVVWENILFAMGVKVLVLILGAGGLASLWEAVFADVGVALIAVVNATRILKRRY